MHMHLLSQQPNVGNQGTANVADYSPKPSGEPPDRGRKELTCVGEDMSRQVASDQADQDSWFTPKSILPVNAIPTKSTESPEK